jgi:tetratricopeptide (TPR) repeat protein
VRTPPPRIRWAAALLLLALATAAVYAPVGGFGYVDYDDQTYVAGNRRVLAGITREGMAWALTTFHGSNWHPLTWYSHMLDVELFGDRPGLFHAVSALIHALNACLLAAILAALTGRFWPSLLAAALFAVHPVRVESVAWISERKDLLGALFFLLALAAHLRHARRPGAARLGITSLLMALGLMAKPMVVTLPFVLLLLDWWPLGRWRRAGPRAAGGGARGVRAWLPLAEKAPLFLLAGLSSWVTVLAQRRGGALESLENLPLAQRGITALRAVAAYLEKAAWPADLAVFYPRPPDGFPWTAAVPAMLLLGLITAAVLRPAASPWGRVGWFWFAGMLVPVLGLVQVGSQAMGDRYLYLPLAGLGWAVVLSLAERVPRRPLPRLAVGAACLILVAVLAAAARRQAGYWRDTTSLFGRAAAVTRDNWAAHHSLGVALAKEGRNREAVEAYRRALVIAPGYAKAWFNLGLALELLGDADGAEMHFRQALRLEPSYGKARFHLGVVLSQKERWPEAAQELAWALTLLEETPEHHYRLARALAGAGRPREAEVHRLRALELSGRGGGG